MPFSFNDMPNGNLILQGIRNGKYNLYLGAGATVNCESQNGSFLLGDALREKIGKIYGKQAKTLPQMARVISSEQMNDVLQSCCKAVKISDAVKFLPNYVWKRIYTLNVDDAIEFSYKSNSFCQQSLISENFKSPFSFESDKTRVQIIHLHGSILKPKDGYVFNANEYINSIKSSNTWLSVFADVFSTDSFIMSGLSFNEPDVSYYLDFRSDKTQKPDAYPSILIEPYPDDYTETVCKDRGFTLVKATFDEFMQALSVELKNPPTVYDLNNTHGNVLSNASEKDRFEFLSRFSPLEFNESKTSEISRFDYGFEPDCIDIQSNKDIVRSITKGIVDDVLKRANSSYGNLFLITGKYLNGKTTVAYRSLKFLSEQGFDVFKLTALSGFDVENAVKCLGLIKTPFVLYIDNLADYIYQVGELLLKLPNLIVLGTERSYRIEHIKKVLVRQIYVYNCDAVTSKETEKLIDKYVLLGKVQNRQVLNKISILTGRTIGEQVCLILDSYKPIHDRIDEFFSRDENGNDLEALLAVAICCRCYKNGASYYVVRGILPNSYAFNKLFKVDSPFKLEFNVNDNNYILPRNSLYFSELLEHYLKKDIKLLRNIYINIYKKLARFVNRETMKRRSPDSMLLARMLDVDRNVSYFFRGSEQVFMNSIEDVSKWNSRYWEQRALSMLGHNIDTALEYARQAVAIEYHPYPLTTLAKVVFAKMNNVSDAEKTACCLEALKLCRDAMVEEGRRRMESIQPLKMLMRGLDSYMKKFSLAENIPFDLRQNIYSAIDTYEQLILMTEYEHDALDRIKQELL